MKLHLSEHNATGYVGVYQAGSRFEVRCNGTYVGRFGSSVDAAVAYARFVGGGGDSDAQGEVEEATGSDCPACRGAHVAHTCERSRANRAERQGLLDAREEMLDAREAGLDAREAAMAQREAAMAQREVAMAQQMAALARQKAAMARAH